MNTEIRPTPETDDAARKGAYLTHGEYPETCGKQIVHIDFARNLERERDSAKSLNRSLLDQLEAKDAQIEAMREEREQWRMSSVCREKDAQLEAMREAIKETATTLENYLTLFSWPELDAPGIKETIAKLKPFIND